MILSYLGNLSEEWNTIVYYIAIVFITLVYVGVIITLLIENRNPVKSLAYILILVFLPGVGLVVYYFLGRDQRRKKKFTLKGDADYKRLKDYIEQDNERHLAIHKVLYELVGQKNNTSRLFMHTRQSILTGNNEVQVLINGEHKFPMLLEDIRNAVHHIHIEYYIYEQDETGLAVANALAEKAKEGVEVRFIYDDFGSAGIGDIPEMLDRSGVEVLCFDPMRWNFYANANYRNHRKIVVIDGRIGYTGGINVSAKYDNRNDNPVFWRDTSVRIEGQAVNLMQLQFLLSYRFCNGGYTFPFDEFYFPDHDQLGTCLIDIVGSGPDSSEAYNMLGILSTINSATSNIRITNPYLIPNEQLLTALKLAAKSGKKVQIILPAKSDSRLVQLAMLSNIKTMLESGIDIFLYEKGFLHAKTMAIDDDISLIGTVNFDARSFYLNFEIAAYFYDRKVNKQLRELFEEDMSFSKKIILSEWKKRPKLQKISESICRLISPLL